MYRGGSGKGEWVLGDGLSLLQSNNATIGMEVSTFKAILIAVTIDQSLENANVIEVIKPLADGRLMGGAENHSTKTTITSQGHIWNVYVGHNTLESWEGCVH